MWNCYPLPLIIVTWFILLGFSISPGIPPHLLAMMPSLPRIPAALFPAQLPLQKSLQAQNNGCSQTTPLIVKPTLQQCATGTPANPSNCLKASREHPEPQETGNKLSIGDCTD